MSNYRFHFIGLETDSDELLAQLFSNAESNVGFMVRML